jgi:DNA-binding Xre family transcriptional regulator
MTHKEFLQRIGMEIKIARIRKGLSNPELSKMTGLSTGSLQKLKEENLTARF